MSVAIVNASIWNWNANFNNALKSDSNDQSSPTGKNGFVSKNNRLEVFNGCITKCVNQIAEPANDLDSFDVIINANNNLIIPGLIGF